MMSPETFPYKASVSVVNLTMGTECIPVIRLCAQAFGVTKEDVLSKTRKQNVAIARHASRHFYHLLIKNCTHMAQAGFSKNHANILHSNKVIRDIATTRNPYRLPFEQAEMEFICVTNKYFHRRRLASYRRRKLHETTNN